VVAIVAALGCVAACSSGSAAHPPPSTVTHPAAATTSTTHPSTITPSSTVWLCRPGAPTDPCTVNEAATVVPAHGARIVDPSSVASSSHFDCFYVYPTVSTEMSDNADLVVQPAEVAVAFTQASRFSSVCRVWAPMYRQRTARSVQAGLATDPKGDTVAFDSLLAAWNDYLAHDNDGRPIIFVGHSQGAAMLIRLLARVVDDDAALRSRVVVAIIAGGNVTVPDGRTVGGSFQHLLLCTAQGEDGCVIAYSAFPGEPPADALFGRAGQGVSLQSGQTQTRGVHVACVNPAALAGGSGDLDTYFVTAMAKPSAPAVRTLWVRFPDLYSSACHDTDGASWLQVDTLDVAGRPVVREVQGPTWGYHAYDINLAVGNLVADIAASEAAYDHAH
jgi:hypothetical protein